MAKVKKGPKFDTSFHFGFNAKPKAGKPRKGQRRKPKGGGS